MKPPLQTGAWSKRKARRTWRWWWIACSAVIASWGGWKRGCSRLRALYARQPSPDVFNALYLAVSEIEGATAASQLAREELRRNPSLRTLDRLLEAELVNAEPDARELFQVEKTLVASHSQRMMRYQCGSCGSGQTVLLALPACRASGQL